MASPAADGPEAAFFVTARVYFQDTDAGGIVYHARFLDFFERARMDWLRSLGMPVGGLADQAGVLFIVRHMDLDYHAPARLDDELRVSVALRELRGARLLLDQSAVRDSQLLVAARVELACVGRDDLRPTRIPPQLRDRLSHRTSPHGA